MCGGGLFFGLGQPYLRVEQARVRGAQRVWLGLQLRRFALGVPQLGRFALHGPIGLATEGST